MIEEIIGEFSNITSNLNYQIEFELPTLKAVNKCAYDMSGDFGEGYYLFLEELFERTLSN